MASEKPHKQDLKSTLKNYSLESTLHGLKPVAEEDGLTTRRLSWIIVLLTASVVMAYLIVSKLMVYYSYPTIVDIGVEYKHQIPFPSVAICNHNPYRLTTLQKHGHYDVVTTAYKRVDQSGVQADRNCTEEEDYLLLDDVCTVPGYTDKEDLNFLVAGVTRSVCRHLCTNLRNTKCSGFLYLTDANSQRCILTAYTGTPKLVDPNGFYNCQGARASYYRRLRCLTVESMECTFVPNEDNCHLSAAPEDSIFGKEWRWIQGSSLIPSVKDHTLSMESGHLLALTPKDGQSGVEARLRTPFMDTTGKCLQLFYIHLQAGSSTLNIRAVRENMTYETVFESKASQGMVVDWEPAFRSLPDGIHMIVLRGVREDGISGIAIDDFRILPCAEFQKNSIFSPSGSEYMGHKSVGFSGQPCFYWTDVSDITVGYEGTFPEESPEKAKNYCRNIGWKSGPWCVTSPNEQETCDIPFTEECDSGFRCESTDRCLPAYAVCDGEPHCEDASDETTPCALRMNLECEFEDAFMCGYVTTPDKGGFRWTRVEDQTWGQQLLLSVGSSNRYVMKVSSEAGTMAGDVAILKSKEHYFYEESLVSFYVKMMVDLEDLDTRLNVHLMTPLGAISETILSIKQRGDNLWIKYYLCVPEGAFTMMFEAILGSTSRPVLALDAVSISDGNTPSSILYEKIVDYEDLDYDGLADDEEMQDSSQPRLMAIYDDVVANEEATDGVKAHGPFKEFITQKEQIAAVYKTCNKSDIASGIVDYQFNCTFDNGPCDFEPRVESQFYTWKLIPKEFLLLSTQNTYMARACGGIYHDSEGYIESPGYPAAYDNNMFCEYIIYQPLGSLLTIQLRDVDLESDPNCSYDNLTIGIGSKPLCGTYSSYETPVLAFPNEYVSIIFESDHSITGRGFSLYYSTTSLESVDYVIAAAYHGQYNPRIYTSQLSSPSFVRNETQCLVFDLFVWERLRVILTERLEETTPQIDVLEVNPNVGTVWHRAFVTLFVGDSNRNRRQHIMFHTEHSIPTPSYTAAIDNIQLLPGRCQDQDVSGSSVNCDFMNIDQCGYVDISVGPLKWMRAFNEEEGYSMACFFEESKGITSGVMLLSPPVSLTSPACLNLVFRVQGSRVSISVKMYHVDETFSTLGVFPNHAFGETNTLLTVPLPPGHYRLVIEALGRSASLHLDNVEVDPLADCPEIDPPTVGLPPDTTTPVAPETTERPHLNQRHPVSGLSSEEIDENTYQYLLSELDISLEDFALLHALPQDDMILECKWDGKDCLPDYVVTETTDMGRCVVFNSVKALNGSLQTSKSGSAHGLQLTVNTARYENVDELSRDSGIKVEVLSQTKLPTVSDTGFVVGAGMHSIVKLDHTLYEYLSDPYGKCGTKELDLYPNTVYTYGACQRDCETRKLDDTCRCHDVYMPGGLSPVCSVQAFLDCVIHQEKVSFGGNQSLGCDPCPAACSNSEYDVQMSYASISTSSIDTLLAENKDRVTKSFHVAKTTKHKINNEDVYKTSKTLKSLGDDLILLRDYFTVNSLEPSTSVFSRVEDGIERIIKDTQHDLKFTIYGSLPDWIENYSNTLQPGRQALLDIIMDSKRVIGYLSQMLLWQTATDAALVDLRIKYSNFQGTCDEVSSNLVRTAMALNDFVAFFGPLPWVNPQQFAGVGNGFLPRNLVYEKNDTMTCENVTSDVLVTAAEAAGQIDLLVSDLEKTLSDHKNDSDLPPLPDVISPDDIQELRATIKRFSHLTDTLIGCTSEYEQYLQTTNSWLETVKFPDYKYSNSLRNSGELSILNGYLAWFQGLYTKYLNGTIDMFGLIEEFESDRKREVITSLESVRTRIQQAVSSPVKGVITDIQKDMISFYTQGLTSLARLSSYFREKSDIVLSPVRQMHIWRKPYASFDNPHILGYRRDEDEAEKSLPVFLLSFIEKGAAENIAEYLSDYFATLTNAIDNIEDMSLLLIKTLQSSMDEMDNVLGDFQDETEVGEDFIRNNILRMDIYFSEIKETSVEQKPEYDLTTFFSDMGGYMGLLLGASVLSFIEILDVFLGYFLKGGIRKDRPADHDNANSHPKESNGLGYDGPIFRVPSDGFSEEEKQTHF